MADLRVHMFGKLCIEAGSVPVEGLDARRVQELLVYLLLYRDHPHPRERLADLMWGESVSLEARKGLRQVLWKLQSVLRLATRPTTPSLLSVDADYVRMNSDADVWLDVAVMEDAWSRSRSITGSAFDAPTAAVVKRAVGVYRGELLEGWYQDWCLFERERLQSMYLDLLHKLMGHAEAHGDFEAGLGYGTAILRIDHARERTHRRMMRLRYLAGDRIGALRQFERCVAALRQELDVEPARRTLELWEQIRTDRVDGPSGSGPLSPKRADLEPEAIDGQGLNGAGRPDMRGGDGARCHDHAPILTDGASPAIGLATVLQDLVQLRSALAQAEARIDRDIAAVAAMMRHGEARKD